MGSMSFASPSHSHLPVPQLGVHRVPGGVTVAVFAAHATSVEFCLIDPVDPGSAGFEDTNTQVTRHNVESESGKQSYTERRFSLSHHTLGVWHDFVPDVPAGALYGFRVNGPWNPAQGLRHNPAKLLTDPYARGLTGTLDFGPHTYGQETDWDTENPRSVVGDAYGPADSRDSLGHTPLSVVVEDADVPDFDAERPYIPWPDTVIYEAHVKGLTALHPDIPEELRGTYAAIGHPAIIEHLKSLGVTTLELLPIHAFTSEPHLFDKELVNYWGYNTLGFFAPHEAYASPAARAGGAQKIIDEVRTMVSALHQAGIEVILDVVYNHTAEGGLAGQHLSFKGLDNTSYYLHDGGTPARYADVTGCGNTLDFRRPKVVQLALDSMRYWLTQIGVDGFRMDLAVTLGRDTEGFNPDHPFLVALQTDPVISRAKLIAEPWDVGPGGWQTGRFPSPLAEWNDRYRDTIRGFWLRDAAAAAHGQPGSGVRELATRLSGSVDLFGHTDPPLMRGPGASINFVTAHDGFTAADLVAYDHKHNEANGEESRDGTNNNRSWNHGVEGPLNEEDPWHVIAPMRRRSIRNLLATLVFSAGVPMLTAGDEVGRSQHGNNNPYCQDNDISWMSWHLSEWRLDLKATVTRLLELRRELPALRVPEFFSGQPLPHDEDHQPDLAWYGADGLRLTVEQWNDPSTRAFQMFRRGRVAEDTGDGDPHVLLIFNGQLSPATLHLPVDDNSTRTWQLVWDSQWENPDEDVPADKFPAGTPVSLEELSLQMYIANAPSVRDAESTH